MTRIGISGGMETLAYFAAALQALGYGLYIRSALRASIRPNPASWLMWAYGTALVLVVEWDQDASGLLLALPAVCAMSGILVAAICWRKGTIRWPAEVEDRAAFAIDLALTAIYLVLLAAGSSGLLSGAVDGWIKGALLVCLSVSTVVSFWPMVRSTRADPSSEHWLPWAVWTAAYAALWVVTVGEEGISWGALQFWVYPMTCMAMSGLVGWLATRPARMKARRRVTDRPAFVRSGSGSRAIGPADLRA